MLQRAMDAGHIDKAYVHDDVRTLAALPAFKALIKSIRDAGQGLMFTAGWPCQGALSC
jgi:capsule polysaccharide export protein KpsC/LpsZ